MTSGRKICWLCEELAYMKRRLESPTRPLEVWKVCRSCHWSIHDRMKRKGIEQEVPEIQKHEPLSMMLKTGKVTV